MISKKVKSTVQVTWLMLMVLFCAACKNKELTKEQELAIVKKCIQTFYSKNSKLTYLVSPQYDTFDFNVFLKENKILEKRQIEPNYNQRKAEVLKILNWNEAEFKAIQKHINANNLNKSNQLLAIASNAKKSHSVYYFSGIHENVVFGYVVDYCKEISASELANPNFNKAQHFMGVYTHIFILKNGNVEKVIDDCGITIDFSCPDSE